MDETAAQQVANEIIHKYEHQFDGVTWAPLALDIAAAIAQAVERERERLMRCIEGTCGHEQGCVAALRVPSPPLDELRKLGSSEYIIRTNNSPPEVTG